MPAYVTWISEEEKERAFRIAKHYFEENPDECKLKRADGDTPVAYIDPMTEERHFLRHSFMMFGFGQGERLVAMKEKPGAGDPPKPQGSSGTIVFCEDQGSEKKMVIKVIHNTVEAYKRTPEGGLIVDVLGSIEALDQQVENECNIMSMLGLLKGHVARSSLSSIKLWDREVLSTTERHVVKKHYLLMDYLGDPIIHHPGMPNIVMRSEVAFELIHALGALHAKGVEHGDIDLSNIVFQEEEDIAVYSYIDYGYSKEISTNKAQADRQTAQDLKDLINALFVYPLLGNGSEVEGNGVDVSPLAFVLSKTEAVDCAYLPSIKLLEVLFLVEQHKDPTALSDRLRQYRCITTNATVAFLIYADFIVSLDQALLISALEKCGVLTDDVVLEQGGLCGLNVSAEDLISVTHSVYRTRDNRHTLDQWRREEPMNSTGTGVEGSRQEVPRRDPFEMAQLLGEGGRQGGHIELDDAVYE